MNGCSFRTVKYQHKQDENSVLHKSNEFLNNKNLSSLAVYAKVSDNGYLEIKNIYKGNDYTYDKHYKSNYIDNYMFCVIINKTNSSKPCYDRAMWTYKDNYKRLNDIGNEVKYVLNKNYTSNQNSLHVTKITKSQILAKRKRINDFKRTLESEKGEQTYAPNQGTSILGGDIIGAIIVGTVGAAISQASEGLKAPTSTIDQLTSKDDCVKACKKKQEEYHKSACKGLPKSPMLKVDFRRSPYRKCTDKALDKYSSCKSECKY